MTFGVVAALQNPDRYVARKVTTPINQDAIMSMTEAEDVLAPAYATFSRRLQAMLYDSACLMCIVAVEVMLVAFGEPFPSAGRVAAGAVLLSFLLYEPVMVSRFGGTVGHRRGNMRVVVDATGSRLGIGRALVRFFLKAVLGIFSFIAMLATTRHQALHDLATGTSVRIHDFTIATESDYRFARPIVGPAHRASRLRRTLMVVGYSASFALVCILLLGVLVSRDCLDVQQCGRTDSAIISWLPVCWLLGSVWAVIAGWQGRLPGARAPVRAREDAT